MMSFQRIAMLFICFGILISGCIDDNPQTGNELEGSTYTGVIPCADCEGIDYRLMIQENNRFKTSSMYIGKSNRRFTAHGSWSIEDDSLLVLSTESGNMRQFKIGDNQLRMLNRDGKVVEGSLADGYLLLRADSPVADERWDEWYKEGIDFRAAGNEPSWGLNIDFDKMMTFKTLNGDSISTPLPQMEQDTASKARVWNAEVESGSLRVEISPTGCVDDMSGEVFGYRVAVMRGDNTFTGCGSYINPKYKLNDFWQLHTLNQSEIDTEKVARQMPALQFDVAKDKVYGTTGCNRLSGTATVEDSSLIFSDMITTKMACPGDLESRFLDGLQKTRSYEISNAELFLLDTEQDIVISFRRAE